MKIFKVLYDNLDLGLLREGHFLAAGISRVIGLFDFGYFFFKNAFCQIFKEPYDNLDLAYLRDRVWEGLSLCSFLGNYFFCTLKTNTFFINFENTL